MVTGLPPEEREMYLLEGPSPGFVLSVLVQGLILIKKLCWVSAVCCGMAVCCLQFSGSKE